MVPTRALWPSSTRTTATRATSHTCDSAICVTTKHQRMSARRTHARYGRCAWCTERLAGHHVVPYVAMYRMLRDGGTSGVQLASIPICHVRHPPCSQPLAASTSMPLQLPRCSSDNTRHMEGMHPARAPARDQQIHRPFTQRNSTRMPTKPARLHSMCLPTSSKGRARKHHAPAPRASIPAPARARCCSPPTGTSPAGSTPRCTPCRPATNHKAL